MSSDWRGNRFRNESAWRGMNFNPKLLPGRRTKSFSILGLFVLWVCFGFFAERAKRAEPTRKRRGVVYCHFTKFPKIKKLTHAS